MADILIRGMEKPGSCRECDFCEVQDINFETLYFCNRNDRFLDDEEACNIPNDCPIIELPEHGNLIDASKIVLKYGGLANISPYDFAGTAEYFAKQIESQPVIIPASKEDFP